MSTSRRLAVNVPALLRGTAPSSGSSVEIAQLWGDSLVGLTHFAPGATVSIGETPDCAFFVSCDRLPTLGAFPLLAFRAGQPFVRLAASFAGSIEKNGESLPLAAWLARGAGPVPNDDVEIPLAPGERIRIDFGDGLVLLLQRVGRVPPVAARSLDSHDLRFRGIFASLVSVSLSVALLARVIAFLGIFATPVEDTTEFRAADIIAIFDIEKVIEKARPNPPKSDPLGGIPDAGAGKKLRGDEGAIGRRDAIHNETKGSAHKNKTDREIVNEKGVLGAMRELGADVNAIFGSGDLGGQMDDNLGALVGPTNADRRGTNAFGLKGDGPGGGGDIINLTEGFGPDGRVRGGRRGPGNKPGDLGPGKRGASIGIAIPDEVLIVGMDPELIDSAVKRHLSQLQACYETRLMQVPELHGKVMVKFTIASDGSVNEAGIDAVSTLTDADVGACLAKRFRMIRFPRPPGGGTVGVRYPLLFKSAGRGG